MSWEKCLFRPFACFLTDVCLSTPELSSTLLRGPIPGGGAGPVLDSSPARGWAGSYPAGVRLRLGRSPGCLLPSRRSLRSRGCSRGSWTSSSRCCGALPPRPSASCRTPWASWTTPCTCAAPAPQVGPPAGHSAPCFPDQLAGKVCPSTLLPLLADYLVSRAQVALDAVSALETGHAQYLTSRSGECRAGLGRERPGHLGAGSTSPGCLLLSGGFLQQVPPPCPPGSLPCRPGSQTWVWFPLRCFLGA